MQASKIAVTEGDGIGKEVVPEGMRVVNRAAQLFGLNIAWQAFDWGCDHHARTGRMMPENGLDRIAGHDVSTAG